MVGWAMLGAALIYLFPAIANHFIDSDLTHTWIATLSRSNYRPEIALGVGGILLVLEIAANWVWYRQFDGKI
jgi:hypothetical protein